MLAQIDAFFDAVGGILSLNPGVIYELQTATYGVSVAVWILVLATISDVVGNSPVLFIHRMSRQRFLAALGIEMLLSLLRLAIWIVSFWMVFFALNAGVVDLANVVLVIGIGYAPMLWSFVVLIPSFGPLLRRALVVWTLLTMTASIVVASNSSPWEALTAPAVVLIVLLGVRYASDRVSVTLLGDLSQRLAGVDLMRRTRAIDPLRVVATDSHAYSGDAP